MRILNFKRKIENRDSKKLKVQNLFKKKLIKNFKCLMFKIIDFSIKINYILFICF